jgi:hypothetical protein
MGQKERIVFMLEIEADAPLQIDHVEAIEEHVLLAITERSTAIGGLDVTDTTGPRIVKVVISHARSGMFRKSVALGRIDGRPIPADERRGEPRDIGREDTE